MSKRPSLTKQVCDALYCQSRFGQSKYDAKQEIISSDRASGSESKKWNPARVEGIYSIETMKTYRKKSIEFMDWVKQKQGCKWFNEAKLYVDEYLQERMDKGDSAWTLQLRRAALRKLYQDMNLANEVKLPLRRKSEIVRSRGHKAMDKKFSVERNRELIDFCGATGLRRHEIQALKVGDVYEADGRTWVYVRQGKGGRPRTVPVLKDLENRVLEIIAGKELDSQVIENIPVRADIHSYRRDYANALYCELAGEEFNPKNKDLSAIRQVSCALGHNRLDVVTRNYLDQGFMSEMV